MSQKIIETRNQKNGLPVRVGEECEARRVDDAPLAVMRSSQSKQRMPANTICIRLIEIAVRSFASRISHSRRVLSSSAWLSANIFSSLATCVISRSTSR